MLLVALAVALLVWFGGLFALRGFRFPVGPDGPVYLWWTRLSGAQGLSTVERPGTMALLGVLRWTGVGLPAAVAGVECALGASVGLGAAALARAGGGSRVAWMLAGVLAGTFASHLVAGYVSNLVFAVPFVGALVVLADDSRGSVVAAAILLGGGALGHPLFFVVGGAIVALAAVLAFGDARQETWRAAIALLGGAAILGLGALAMLAGPAIVRADTSQDAFMRRVGLGGELAHAYRDRFIHRWTRYVQWASVPLAVFGARRPEGWVRRVLWAWFAVTVGGVLIGFATAWFPPDRFVSFGYAIPVLAAFGVVALAHRWRRRRWVAVAAAVALSIAMVAGAGIAWLREKPYLSPEAVRDVELASRVADASPPGTPWIVPVDSPSDVVSFIATRLQNVIRAAVPPERMADVFVVVPPPPPGLAPDDRRQWSVLASTYAADAARAAERHTPVVLDVSAFRTAAMRPPACEGTVCDALYAPMRSVGPGVSVSASVVPVASTPASPPEPADPLASSTARAVLAAPLVLAVLGVAGFGWSALVSRERARALALAPAFGTAAIALGGVVADRLGLRLSSAGHGLLVLALVTLGGYVALIAERRGRARPAP